MSPTMAATITPAMSADEGCVDELLETSAGRLTALGILEWVGKDVDALSVEGFGSSEVGVVLEEGATTPPVVASELNFVGDTVVEAGCAAKPS